MFITTLNTSSLFRTMYVEQLFIYVLAMNQKIYSYNLNSFTNKPATKICNFIRSHFLLSSHKNILNSIYKMCKHATKVFTSPSSVPQSA